MHHSLVNNIKLTTSVVHSISISIIYASVMSGFDASGQLHRPKISLKDKLGIMWGDQPEIIRDQGVGLTNSIDIDKIVIIFKLIYNNILLKFVHITSSLTIFSSRSWHFFHSEAGGVGSCPQCPSFYRHPASWRPPAGHARSSEAGGSWSTQPLKMV